MTQSNEMNPFAESVLDRGIANWRPRILSLLATAPDGMLHKEICEALGTSDIDGVLNLSDIINKVGVPDSYRYLLTPTGLQEVAAIARVRLLYSLKSEPKKAAKDLENAVTIRATSTPDVPINAVDGTENLVAEFDTMNSSKNYSVFFGRGRIV